MQLVRRMVAVLPCMTWPMNSSDGPVGLYRCIRFYGTPCSSVSPPQPWMPGSACCRCARSHAGSDRDQSSSPHAPLPGPVSSRMAGGRPHPPPGGYQGALPVPPTPQGARRAARQAHGHLDLLPPLLPPPPPQHLLPPALDAQICLRPQLSAWRAQLHPQSFGDRRGAVSRRCRLHRQVHCAGPCSICAAFAPYTQANICLGVRSDCMHG